MLFQPLGLMTTLVFMGGNHEPHWSLNIGTMAVKAWHKHHTLRQAWLQRAISLLGGEAQPLRGLEEVLDGRQPSRSNIQNELISMGIAS